MSEKKHEFEISFKIFFLFLMAIPAINYTQLLISGGHLEKQGFLLNFILTPLIGSIVYYFMNGKSFNKIKSWKGLITIWITVMVLLIIAAIFSNSWQ